MLNIIYYASIQFFFTIYPPPCRPPSPVPNAALYPSVAGAREANVAGRTLVVRILFIFLQS